MGGGSTSWSDSHDYDWSSSSTVTKKSARSYAQDDKRTYTGHTSQGLEPPVGKNISTDSSLAALLVVDVTGSMNKWPGLIFEKIPTLYNETNAILQGIDLDELKNGKKLEQLLELAVLAVGDAKGDSFPLQVLDFSKGPDLVNGVNTIFPEGGGGGNAKESYDLAAYYTLHHCKTPKIPKSVKPLLIIAGDEGFYDTIDKRLVKKYIGDDLDNSLTTETMMKKLASKYDTYLLRPEECYEADTYARIHKQWQDVLGVEKVYKMTDPKRLVDCVIGIASLHADKFDLGVQILERRQTASQVKEVLETLHPHPTVQKYQK